MLSMLIRQWGRIYSDRIAQVFEGDELTFAELLDRSESLGAALLGLGLGTNDRVVTLSANSGRTLEQMMGLHISGLARAGLNLRNSSRLNEHLFDYARASAIITDVERYHENAEWLERKQGAHVIVCDPEPELKRGGVLDYEALLESGRGGRLPAYLPGSTYSHLAFSAGTTGMPKAIVHDHDGWTSIFRSQYLTLPEVGEDDVFLAAGPLTHATMMMVYSLFGRGGKVVILNRFTPADVIAAVRDHKVTITFMVPTMLDMVLRCEDFTPEALSSLRAVIYAGAPMPLRVLERALEALGPVFYQNYGQTETVIASVLSAADHAEIVADPSKRHLLKSAGRPFPDAVVEIRDEHDNRAGPGMIGEITMRCAGTMVGLFEDPQGTADRLTPEGLVRSRDMGYMDEHGYLFIVDRKDDMIISGGFNIWPSEIENAIALDESVRQVVVFGMPHEKWGETPWAVVRAAKGHTIDPQALMDRVVKELGSMKKPARVIVLDEDIPLTPTGKISRSLVRNEIRAQFPNLNDM